MKQKKPLCVNTLLFPCFSILLYTFCDTICFYLIHDGLFNSDRETCGTTGARFPFYFFPPFSSLYRIHLWTWLCVTIVCEAGRQRDRLCLSIPVLAVCHISFLCGSLYLYVTTMRCITTSRTYKPDNARQSLAFPFRSSAHPYSPIR